MLNLTNKTWWFYLSEDLKELLTESLLLLDDAAGWTKKFHDYSFVVFPAAKAYEGFLKKLFLDLGFINKEDYFGKRFRIGKALNPALDPDIRERFGVYDKIVDYCGGKDLADKLWNTWKKSRNLLFHWFPEEANAITLDEAKDRVNDILESMDISFKDCKIN